MRSDAVLSQIDSQNQGGKIREVDEAKLSMLIFQFGEELFAFHGNQAREILPFHGVTWIPGATANIPGVVNLRGDVVAVLDLRHLLGLGKTDGAAFLVMLRLGDGRAGVIVDRIVDVAEIPVSLNGPALSTLDERLRRFAVSQFVYGERMVTVLDARGLLETVNA